jgi:protein-disulfide isomerase
MDAALLAECVSNDKYFSFANLLFKKQRDWTLAFEPYKVLMQYAALSGVSNDYAEACLRADKTAERLLTDRQAGITDLGINGTPSFVVSSALGNEMVSGVRSVADFKDILNRHLSAGEKR